MKIDKINREILRILREQARSSYVKIAKKVGLSEGGVRRRIKKLIESGIIKKFTIEVEKVGYVSAFILVKTDPSIPPNKIISEIKKLEVAREICEIAGPYDIAFLLEEFDLKSLNDRIDEVRRIPGVIDTSSFIILRKY